MNNKEIIFFAPPSADLGVSRIREDGGAKDILFNMYTREIGEGKIISGYWECFEGKIVIESAPTNEICFITEGSAIIINQKGEERKVVPGDALLIPRGAYSHWVIEERVKKIYFTVIETE